jgi:hypothetical protein
MKLSKLAELIKIDLRLPMRIKATNNNVNVGDIIGFNEMGWSCCIVDKIESTAYGTQYWGKFVDYPIGTKKIDFEELKRVRNSYNRHLYLTLNEYANKYVVKI